MSVLNVNTINERTSNSGVTIDGVLIKDGVVTGHQGVTEYDVWQLNANLTASGCPYYKF